MHGFTHLQMWLCGCLCCCCWVRRFDPLLVSTQQPTHNERPPSFLGLRCAGPRDAGIARCLVPQLTACVGYSAPPPLLLGETRRQDDQPKGHRRPRLIHLHTCPLLHPTRTLRIRSHASLLSSLVSLEATQSLLPPSSSSSSSSRHHHHHHYTSIA